MKKELIGMGKFISMVLRHKPETIGITLDKEGWADVNLLIDNASIYQKSKGLTPVTRELLDEIVTTNEKQRFEYSDDGWSIRARQGHSVSVDLAYKPQIPPQYLYHGTATKFVSSIQVNGLDKRKRHHVHLSKDHATASQVGSRHGTPHVLTIESGLMHQDGFVFYQTDNSVWLVESVPVEYIHFENSKLDKNV